MRPLALDAMKTASRLADLVKLAHLSACPWISRPVEAADRPAAEQLLLTIGRSGVLSCRAIGEKEIDTLLHLLARRPNVSGATSSGPPISSWSRTAT